MANQSISSDTSGLKVETRQFSDSDEAIGDCKEEPFMCEEEPHMFPAHSAYGYYPLALGDLLDDGRYEIVRKLGWGSNSSVWLAVVCDQNRAEGSNDEEIEVEQRNSQSKREWKNEYVAIKVLTVNTTAGIVVGDLHEVDSFRRVTSFNSEHPGYKHCIALRDLFMGMSKHGPHFCFVTDVLGVNMETLKESLPNKVFPVSVLKRIIKQILLALDYLRECDLVHADVKADNILLSVYGADAAITEFLNQNPSESYKPRIHLGISPDPILTVKTQPLPSFNVDPTFSNIVVHLIDYGHATPVGETPNYKVQSISLRAPEVILSEPWSTPIDIWSLGVIAYESLVLGELFELDESSTNVDNSHLQSIVEYLGPFPESFLAECSHRAEHFDEQGSLLHVNNFTPCSVEGSLRSDGFLEEEDISPTSAFILQCLALNPTMRPTASELLDDNWLKEVIDN